MLSEIRAGPYTIRGISLGGLYTGMMVPELDLALDAGMPARSFAGARTLLLTHGHVDHAGALSSLLGIRALQGVRQPLRVIMPAEIAGHVQSALDAMSALQHWPLAIEAVGLRAGEECALGNGLTVRAVQAFHVVPCLGYQVLRRVRRLRQAFRHLPGEEIRRLTVAGEALFESHEHLEFAYATDTLVSVLDHMPSLYDSRVLLMECTFLDGRKSLEAVHAGCHIHLDELVARAHHFRNEHVVLMHVSQMYRPAEICAILDARLPAALRGRVQVLAPVSGHWPG